MGYANFSAWTEVDPNNKLSQTVIRATWANMIRNEACYLYDYRETTAEFTHRLKFQLSSIDVNTDATSNIIAYIWVICEHAGRPAYLEVGKCINLSILEKGSSTTLFQLYLSHKDDSVQDTSTDLSVGTTYYLKIVKSGVVVTCSIYSDVGESTLVDAITIDLTGEDEESMTFNYVETTASYDDTGDGNDQSDGWVESLRYDGGGLGSGKQVDIVEGANKLSIDPISWKEVQECKVAIRPVPLRSSGPNVDTGTWVLTTREITIVVRLSDAEKTTLQTIFDNGERVWIFTETGWYYLGLLRGKPTKYEYRVVDGTLRPWLYKLTYDSEVMNYVP